MHPILWGYGYAPLEKKNSQFFLPKHNETHSHFLIHFLINILQKLMHHIKIFVPKIYPHQKPQNIIKHIYVSFVFCVFFFYSSSRIQENLGLLQLPIAREIELSVSQSHILIFLTLIISLYAYSGFYNFIYISFFILFRLNNFHIEYTWLTTIFKDCSVYFA